MFRCLMLRPLFHRGDNVYIHHTSYHHTGHHLSKPKLELRYSFQGGTGGQFLSLGTFELWSSRGLTPFRDGTHGTYLCWDGEERSRTTGLSPLHRWLGWKLFVDENASPNPWRHTFQSLKSKKKMMISQQRVGQFRRCFFHPICYFFLGSKMVSFFHLSEVIFRVINFHVNIIKRESLNWLPGRRELFFLFLQGMLDGVVKICRCWVFSSIVVVSWYFVSYGQSIWLAGKCTIFFKNTGFLRFIFWSKIK